MVKRKSIPAHSALPYKQLIPDDELWQSETCIQDYLFSECGNVFDMPEELISYWNSTKSVSFDKFKRRWQDFSGSASEFIQFSRDFNRHWTSLHYSDTLTINELDEIYNFALAERLNMSKELFLYWQNTKAIPFSKFIHRWQNFCGSDSEFIDYLRDFNGNWTSLHYSSNLTPVSLELMHSLALVELSETEQWLINAECEMYFEEHEVSDEDDDKAIQGYDEYCTSRCDGNHSRYLRRLYDARYRRRKINLAIPDVSSINSRSKFDGSVMIHGGLLWQRYDYAKTVLDALDAWERYRYHDDTFELTQSIKHAINVLDDFGPISYRTHADLLFIIKKYKKLVSYARHYNYYYDGRYFVVTPFEDVVDQEAPVKPTWEIQKSKKKQKRRYFVVDPKTGKVQIYSDKPSHDDATSKQKLAYLNADYRMLAKQNTHPSNVKVSPSTKAELLMMASQVPSVLAHLCIPGTLYKGL